MPVITTLQKALGSSVARNLLSFAQPVPKLAACEPPWGSGRSPLHRPCLPPSVQTASLAGPEPQALLRAQPGGIPGPRLPAHCSCSHGISPPKTAVLAAINKRTRSHSPRLPGLFHICQLYRPEAIKSVRPGRLFLIILSLFAIFSTATREKPISNFFKGAKWLLHCIVKVYHQPSSCKAGSGFPAPGP